MISYAADTREKDFKTFAVRRLARLYSVLLPALALSLVLDRAGVRIAPDIYAGRASFDHTALRLLIHGTFLQQIWLASVRFSSNGPLWSLGYEFFYYTLFALAVLYRGPCRRLLFAACAMLAGPCILIYGLIWLLGYAAYKIHKRDAFSWPPAAAASVFPLTFAAFCAWPEWSELFATGLHLHKKLDMDIILSDFAAAALVFLNIISARPGFLDKLRPIARAIRFAAGMSFSLYAFHYPLMLFFGALNERYAGLGGATEFAVLLPLILLSVWMLSFISEKRKNQYTALFTAAAEYMERLNPKRAAFP